MFRAQNYKRIHARQCRYAYFANAVRRSCRPVFGVVSDVRHPGRRWRTSRSGIEPIIGQDRADPFRRLRVCLVAALRQLACIVGCRFPMPALWTLRRDDEKNAKKSLIITMNANIIYICR